MDKNKLFRSTLLALVIIATIYTFFRISADNINTVFNLLLQHLLMVTLSMVIATTIGISIGVILSRSSFSKYQHLVMYIVGLGQTIPSLAVLALAMSVLGIGIKPAIFAITIYTILPIARNTLSGLNSVSAELIDAARGMGLPPLKILWEIELPNALRVIIAGIRTALVINIGTTALGSLIGAGGLGEQIFTGISFLDPWIMLSGALPTALLALIGDNSLRWLEGIIISEGLKDG